jgi:hypothetical protein
MTQRGGGKEESILAVVAEIPVSGGINGSDYSGDIR